MRQSVPLPSWMDTVMELDVVFVTETLEKLDDKSSDSVCVCVRVIV